MSKEELISLAGKVREAFDMNSNMRICGIGEDYIHFSTIIGFKDFVGKENFEKAKVINNDACLELLYAVNDNLIVRVLI